MANVSNLKIDERSYVEWPNLRVTEIENENENMGIGKIASSAGHWKGGQFQNC